jgi:hypothetical protein
MEGVGEPLGDAVAHSEGLTVEQEEREGLRLPEAAAEPVAKREGLTVPLGHALGVLVCEGVGDAREETEGQELPLSVRLEQDVPEGERVPLKVCVPLPVREGVRVPHAVPLVLRDSVTLVEKDGLLEADILTGVALPEKDPPGRAAAPALAVTLGQELMDSVPLGQAVREGDKEVVCENCAEFEAVIVPDALRDMEGLGVGEMLLEGEPVKEALPHEERDMVGLPLREGETEPERD